MFIMNMELSAHPTPHPPPPLHPCQLDPQSLVPLKGTFCSLTKASQQPLQLSRVTQNKERCLTVPLLKI